VFIFKKNPAYFVQIWRWDLQQNLSAIFHFGLDSVAVRFIVDVI